MSMSKKIKAIIKRPDEDHGHSTWISNNLDNLQRTVEGYIEAVTYGESIGYPGFVIVCNDEGRIRELPYNCEVGGNLFFGTIRNGVNYSQFTQTSSQELKAIHIRTLSQKRLSLSGLESLLTRTLVLNMMKA